MQQLLHSCHELSVSTQLNSTAQLAYLLASVKGLASKHSLVTQSSHLRLPCRRVNSINLKMKSFWRWYYEGADKQKHTASANFLGTRGRDVMNFMNAYADHQQHGWEPDRPAESKLCTRDVESKTAHTFSEYTELSLWLSNVHLFIAAPVNCCPAIKKYTGWSLDMHNRANMSLTFVARCIT